MSSAVTPLHSSANQRSVARRSAQRCAARLPFGMMALLAWEILKAATPGARAEVVFFRLLCAAVWIVMGAALLVARLGWPEERRRQMQVRVWAASWVLIGTVHDVRPRTP